MTSGNREVPISQKKTTMQQLLFVFVWILPIKVEIAEVCLLLYQKSLSFVNRDKFFQSGPRAKMQ
jgi:hypothetical protein